MQRSANVSATRNAPPQPEIYAAPILIVSREQLTCLAARYATLKPTRSTDGIEVVRVDTLDCM